MKREGGLLAAAHGGETYVRDPKSARVMGSGEGSETGRRRTYEY